MRKKIIILKFFILQQNNSWPTKFCAIGAVIFTISDALIAFNMFLTDIPYAEVLIMVTYYIAQLGISFVVLDSKKTKM